MCACIAVNLLSLRAQLQSSLVGGKPIITCTLTPEGASDTSRCVSVAWIPKSDAGIFAAAFSSGSIYVYRKVGPVISQEAWAGH